LAGWGRFVGSGVILVVGSAEFRVVVLEVQDEGDAGEVKSDRQ
jgi:hypothetical protein